MDVKQKDDGKKGSFYIELNGNKEAEMTYVWAGEARFIIDHTEVSEQLKGKNAGKQLLQQAVNFAREKNVKIMPLCPFAKAMFHKIPEHADVLF